MILLDTDVVSGLMRSPRDPALVAWMSSLASIQLAVSTVTIAEISFGLERLPNGRRKADLVGAFGRLADLARIVDFDRHMATRCAIMRASRQATGRPMALADGLIAATAYVLDLNLATRNVRDFDGVGLRVVNPWQP